MLCISICSLVHEVTSPQAFEGLRLSGRKVRRPDLTFATMDHNVPTKDRFNITDPISKQQIDTLTQNCQDFGVTLFDLTASTKVLCTLWDLSLVLHIQVKRSFAATAILRRMALSAHLLSVLAQVRLSTFLRRNVCNNPKQKRWKFVLRQAANQA